MVGMDTGFPVMMILIIAVSTLLPLGITAAVFFFLFRARAQRAQLVATGIPAQAMIVQVADTGVRINDQPRLELVLDVHPMHGSMPFAPFRTTHTGTVPMMAMSRVGPGSTVPVKLDQTNPANLAIDWAAMGFMV
jgi:hypothetical protein